MTLPLAALLLLAAPLQVPQHAPEAPPRPSPEVEAEAAAWRALVARDARVAWTGRTEELALLALDANALSESDRAVALYAVGVGRAVHGRALLEDVARSGTPLERRAALLGLAEIGVGIERLAAEQAESAEDPAVAEAAVLALLRTGRVSARRRAVELSEREGAPAIATLPELLQFLAEPEESRPTDATRLLLDLRWRAAKAYGLVDGEAWAILLGRRVLARQDFLDEVVLRSAAELRRPGVNDHLLGALFESSSSAAVRAAARAMPAELEQLALHDLWQPSPEDLRRIVEEVELSGVRDEAVPLLERAARDGELRLRAMRLLARAGVTDGLEGLAEEWPLLSTEHRILTCEAWGASGLDEALGWLGGREEAANPAVRAAVWVARARLSDTEARGHVGAVLADPTAPDHVAFVEASLRAATDHAVSALLSDAVDGLEGELRLRVACALCRGGRLAPLAYVLEALREGLPEGELGLEVLRAIGERGSVEDRLRLAQLFPFERDEELPPDVNALLARQMLRDRDIRVLPVLRAALWSDPVDRSLLAGALIVDIGGDYSLREEIVRRPTSATDRDYRRVGFAVGEWGGMEAMRALAAHPRIHPGDPVLEGALLGALASRTR